MNTREVAVEVLRHVLAATIYASALALVVAGLQALCKRRLDPGWRWALWIPILLRLLWPNFPESSISLFNTPNWTRHFFAKPAPAGPAEIVEPAAAPHAMVTPINPVRLPAVAPNPPPAKPLAPLELAAFVYLAVSALLFARLAAGSIWLRIRLRRHGVAIDPELAEVVRQACVELGVRKPPQVVETACVNSPGLFGCVRPKLLLPPGFKRSLSDSELRHVFLHEAAHLKRGDLWWNGLMMLALALHWFNPLIWLVLRRMRVLRELACDQMVLRTTSDDESQAYGTTILKLLERVTARPIVRVVGILEEKESARLRLEQIATFPSAPKRGRFAGAILLALIVAAGLSNAETGEKVTAPTAVETPPAASPSQRVDPWRVAYEAQKKKVEQLQLRVDQWRERLNPPEGPGGELQAPSERAASDPPGEVETKYQPYFEAKRELENHQRILDTIYIRLLVERDGAAAPQRATPPRDNARRVQVFERLKSITLTSWGVASETRLAEVMQDLAEQAKEHDPDKLGINLLCSSIIEEQFDPSSGRRKRSVAVQVEDFLVRITPPLLNVSLLQALNAVEAAAQPPPGQDQSNRIMYSIEGYGVVLSQRLAEPERLYTRTYRLQRENLQGMAGKTNAAESPMESMRKMFEAAGLHFPQPLLGNELNEPSRVKPPQKAFFFNDKTGILFVRSTLADLDAVSALLQTLPVSPPQQVVIETRVIALTKAAGEIAGAHLSTAQANMLQAGGTELSGQGLLTGEQFRQLLDLFKQTEGVEFFGPVKITSLSGRPARISLDPGRVVLLPEVQPDGRAIRLEASFEFPRDGDGKGVTKTTAAGAIWDGQSLIFWLHPNGAGESFAAFLILLQPSLVDPAGNLIHNPDTTPEGFPSQRID